MNKNPILRAALFLAIVAVLASSVRAEFVVNLYSNEFSIASSSDNVKICSCANRIDTYEITNVGNVASTFSLSADSSIKEWIALSQNSFTLNPGAAERMQAAISIPCGKEGSWSYTLTAKTNYGRQKSFAKPVAAQTCQNIKAILNYYNASVNPCENIQYELELENVGTFKETYDVSLGSYEKYATFSEKSVRLAPGEKKTVFITLQLPCTSYGEFPLEFNVHAEQNNINQEIAHTLMINKAYDYSIDLAETGKTCSRVSGKIPVTFTNNAGMPNDYDIGFTGPGFASAGPKILHLNPGESKGFDILTKPEINDEGTVPLTVSATSQLGAVAKAKTMNLEIQHCYDHTVAIAPQLDTVCCGKKTYTVTVTNKGLFTETYYMKIKSSVLAHLSQDAITLVPGESKDLTLEIDVPCLDDQFDVRVYAEAASTGLSADDVLTLHTLTTESCTRVKVTTDDLKITYGDSGTKILVRNIGIRGGTYAFAYQGKFLTTPINEITLMPGEEKEIALHAYNLTSYFKGTYLDEATFVHKDNQVQYNETVRVTLGQRNIIVRFFSAVFSSTKCTIFFIILIIGIVLAAILLFFKGILSIFKNERRALYFRRTPYTADRKWRLFFAFIVIFAILFIAGFLVSDRSTYRPVHKPLYYEVYQDKSLSINLGQYYDDPDKDTLTYTSTHPENLAVDIKGNIATITPDQSFSGERGVVFTADDGHGGKTDSAVITIKVLPVQKMTPYRLAKKYCPFIFLIPLLIIWLIALLIHIDNGRMVWYYRERKR